MKKIWFRQHNISYILLSVFFICSVHTAKCQEPRKEKQVIFTEAKFRPYMAIHENPGCPENSYCSAKAGKIMRGWYNLLKKTKNVRIMDKYRQSKGIPIEAWSTQIKFKEDAIIGWDSHCQLHNKENNIFKEVTFFTKKKLKSNNSKIFFEKLYLLTSKKIVSYPILRGEKPIYMDGNKLIFLKEEDGRYYGVSVSSNSSLTLVKTVNPKNLPQKVQCPPNLVKKYNQKIKDKIFYEGYECQNIWNKKSNKYNLIMFGLTCF